MSGAWSLDEAGAGGALGASAASGSGSTAETRQQGKRALTGPCRHALGGKGKQGIMFCKTFFDPQRECSQSPGREREEAQEHHACAAHGGAEE